MNQLASERLVVVVLSFAGVDVAGELKGLSLFGGSVPKSTAPWDVVPDVDVAWISVGGVLVACCSTTDGVEVAGLLVADSSGEVDWLPEVMVYDWPEAPRSAASWSPVMHTVEPSEFPIQRRDVAMSSLLVKRSAKPDTAATSVSSFAESSLMAFMAAARMGRS